MISLRPAVQADSAAIHDVLIQAFNGPDEAALVDALRAAGDVLLELAAESGDRVIGHILYSPLPLVSPSRTVRAAALAPLAVHPNFQRRGAGGALIHMSLPMLAHSGVEAVVVLGEPAYYSRFGFSPEAAAHLRHPFPPGPHFMALELSPGCLDEFHGEVRYAAAFGLPA
ncbi:MAG: N-acetyltransferase [Candidatus Solibacter usitatus]|nr:N-acetyltransferase [Candidatus Solibacter usitatus]